MKVHASLNELLEAWDAFFRIENATRKKNRSIIKIRKDFVASNSLASVEPEPLAKKKQRI